MREHLGSCHGLYVVSRDVFQSFEASSKFHLSYFTVTANY